MQKQYSRGKNPNSAHGKSTGRPPEHGTKKVSLNVTVTEEAKEGLRAIASSKNLSISELFQQIGDGTIDISI